MTAATTITPATRVVCVCVATTAPRSAAIMHAQPLGTGYIVRYLYEEDWATARDARQDEQEKPS